MKTGFRTTVRRELQRIASRPLYILVCLVLPLVSFVFFTTLFGEGVLRDLPVAVYDADGSSMSRQLVRHVGSSSGVELKKVGDIETGRKQIEQGNTFGLLIIPKDFQQLVLRGESPDVVLYYSNLNLGAGGIVSSNVQTAVMTVAAGANLQKRMLKGAMRAQAMEQVRPVTVDSHVLYNPVTNYVQYLSTALLPIMLQMFIIVTVIFSIGLELKESTAKEWLDQAGGSMLKATAGKLLPYTISFILLGLFINSLLFDYLEIPVNGSRLVIDISIILMVLAYHAMALLLIFGTANLRLSVSVGAGYGAMAFSFCGLAYPIKSMPEFYQYFANIFPYRFYLQIFIDQAYRAAPASFTASHLLALTSFLILPFFVIKRGRKVVSSPTYWGKL